MILGFSTKINEKATHFVDKIWSGLIANKIASITDCRTFEEFGTVETNRVINITPYHKPKLHTIREDKNNRWRAGVMIDFFINVRKKDMFRFAPKTLVIITQKIEIKYIPLTIPLGEKRPFVKIDGKLIYDILGDEKEIMLRLALNDGFDSIEAFFQYFNEDFTGKIIHWTDLKY